MGLHTVVWPLPQFAEVLNLLNGLPLSTDKIALHGSQFQVLLSGAHHYYLGVYTSVLGDFHTESINGRHCEEMNQHIDFLLLDVRMCSDYNGVGFGS